MNRTNFFDMPDEELGRPYEGGKLIMELIQFTKEKAMQKPPDVDIEICIFESRATRAFANTLHKVNVGVAEKYKSKNDPKTFTFWLGDIVPLNQEQVTENLMQNLQEFFNRKKFVVIMELKGRHC